METLGKEIGRATHTVSEQRCSEIGVGSPRLTRRSRHEEVPLTLYRNPACHGDGSMLPDDAADAEGGSTFSNTNCAMLNSTVAPQ